ncbi:hypothetical protein CVIRNUC_001226 [Coccomyxa viridis]|uniref:Uncharacterized protein n=1 Tax=Coccomyxa viridis TaxID=1274662 RepID=A0AAV1HU78_9CHLO|nr:hypothetical protein CVIRNUC_001226 [Coccomyxa viridis]
MPLNGASASMEYQKDVEIADACQREVTFAVSPEPLAQLVGTVLSEQYPCGMKMKSRLML